MSKLSIDEAAGYITITYVTEIDSGATMVLNPFNGGKAVGNVFTGGTPTSSTIPTAGSISWNCTTASSPAIGVKGTLKSKYASAECRT